MNPTRQCAAILMMFISIAAVCHAGEQPTSIGLQKQLLVDDHVIANKQNVTRVLGQVTKANDGNPVVCADKPWEDDAFGFFGTALYDQGKFRMWYRPWPCAVAYAESNDGLNWHKPSLGIYDFSIARANKESGIDGTFRPRDGMPTDWHGKDNNIVGVFGDGFSCFVDSHETDPAYRYKMCYGHPTKICACLGYSPDGIHWTPYNNGEPVTGRASDTYNQLLWDEGSKTYRLLTRTDFGNDKVEIRGTRIMANPDLKSNLTGWKTLREWHFDRDGADEYARRQIYGMTDWIYEGIHFGLLLVYEWPDIAANGAAFDTNDKELFVRHERDIMNFYIATCRDGVNWDFDWVYQEQPLVPRGPDGAFDKDMIIPSSNIITHGDKHWIYYVGFRERHQWLPRKTEIGLATLPLDRFVGLKATSQAGIVTTQPFTLDGSALQVNVDATNGSAAVEVLDEKGEPIPGFAAAGCQPIKNSDELRLTINWQGSHSLAELKGRTVRLRFTLCDATLFAFQVLP